MLPLRLPLPFTRDATTPPSKTPAKVKDTTLRMPEGSNPAPVRIPRVSSAMLRRSPASMQTDREPSLRLSPAVRPAKKAVRKLREELQYPKAAEPMGSLESSNAASGSRRSAESPHAPMARSSRRRLPAGFLLWIKRSTPTDKIGTSYSLWGCFMPARFISAWRRWPPRPRSWPWSGWPTS